MDCAINCFNTAQERIVMLRKLIEYVAAHYDQRSTYEHVMIHGKLDSQEKLYAAIDSLTDFTELLLNPEKILAEVADLKAKPMLRDDLQNYVVCFALICVSENTREIEKAVALHHKSNEEIRETYRHHKIYEFFHIESFLLKQSKNKNVAPFVQHVSTELLIRNAWRGNRLALHVLVEDMISQGDRQSELLYSLLCLDVLDVHNQRYKYENGASHLISFFLHENFVTKSQDPEEAVYWVSPANTSFDSKRSHLRHATPFASSLLGFEISRSKYSGFSPGPVQNISAEAMKDYRAFFYRCYDAHDGNLSSAQKGKKEFLAAMLYFSAAEYHLSYFRLERCSEAQRSLGMDYLALACETIPLHLELPSHYRLLANILFQLEKLLQTESRALGLYATYKEKYDRYIQKHVAVLRKAEQSMHQKRVALSAPESGLSTVAKVAKQIEMKRDPKAEEKVMKSPLTAPQVPEEGLQTLQSSSENESAKSALSAIADLLREADIEAAVGVEKKKEGLGMTKGRSGYSA